MENSAVIKENKMGTMPINKLLLSMSVPMMLSMLVQALYNIVDSMYVARISEDALTAVSLAFPIQNLMIAVGTGTGVGINALLSRSLGEKNRNYASKTANNGLLLAIASFLLFAVITSVFGKVFFAVQTDNQVIIDHGTSYIRIIGMLSFGLFFQMTLERLLQATGKTVYSMIIQMTGAVINIILDPIFIFALGMGVKGAALATILSQSVGAVWVLRFLTGNKTILKLRIKNFKLKSSVILPCLALGVSTFIMLSTESLLNISFNSSLARFGGDIAVGSMTIISSVSQLITLPLAGICQGAQPIASFNYGAGNKERVLKVFKYTLLLCVSYASLGCILTLVMPRFFAGIFSSDEVLIENAAWCMRVYMAGIFSFGFQNSCQQTFVALGQAKTSLLLACLRKLILLIPLIFILPFFFENKVFAVFLAEPVSDILAATVTTTTFFTRIRGILEKGAKKV